jgi:hypothetical protein
MRRDITGKVVWVRIAAKVLTKFLSDNNKNAPGDQ